MKSGDGGPGRPVFSSCSWPVARLGSPRTVANVSKWAPPPESALGSPAASEGCAEKGVPVSCGSVIARNFPPGAVRQGACPEHQAGPRGFMPRPGSLDLRLRFLRRRPPSRIGGCGQRLCSSLLFPSVRGGTGPPPLRAPAAQRSPQAGAELLPEGKPPCLEFSESLLLGLLTKCSCIFKCCQ